MIPLSAYLSAPPVMVNVLPEPVCREIHCKIRSTHMQGRNSDAGLDIIIDSVDSISRDGS